MQKVTQAFGREFGGKLSRKFIKIHQFCAKICEFLSKTTIFLMALQILSKKVIQSPL